MLEIDADAAAKLTTVRSSIARAVDVGIIISFVRPPEVVTKGSAVVVVTVSLLIVATVSVEIVTVSGKETGGCPVFGSYVVA